ncbi:hypothetical protein B0H19DRAFT_112981 [Mycena capillaripes]|nr:hypothetical protein B0H19DRAFT_112981 [Mycena capillaripes]
MCLINLPAANQSTFFFFTYVPALSLLPLLALLILVMKRKLSPTPSDPEDQGFSAWDEPFKGSSLWEESSSIASSSNEVPLASEKGPSADWTRCANQGEPFKGSSSWRESSSITSQRFKGSSSWKESSSIACSSNEVLSATEEPWANETHPAKFPRRQSPSRRKRRKAIPKRMRHMTKNMTVWGDRWMSAVEPSTAGSQQGEIDPTGTYTVSTSPPPAYRKTPLPLSPVVMASSSSPTIRPLSSNFTPPEDPAPPSVSLGSPSLAEMLLFGSLDGVEPFDQLSDAIAGASSHIFDEGLSAFDFNAETSSSLSYNAHTAPPPFTSHLPDPISDSMALLNFHSHGPLAGLPSDANNSHITYPIHGTNAFSDWILPPTQQPSLPVNVAHFADGLNYNLALSFSYPSQNVSDFPTTAWASSNIQHHGGIGPSMSQLGGYSTLPMSTPPVYTGPYIPIPDRRSAVYQSSGSESPLAPYSRQSPQYYPHPSLSPLTTRTGSSGSLYSMDNHSPHSMPYSDFDYTYSSPHFTGSPSSSVYRGLEGYPSIIGNTSRTVPLPFYNAPPPRLDDSHWLM